VVAATVDIPWLRGGMHPASVCVVSAQLSARITEQLSDRTKGDITDLLGRRGARLIILACH
jgi:hypothetical protein